MIAKSSWGDFTGSDDSQDRVLGFSAPPDAGFSLIFSSGRVLDTQRSPVPISGVREVPWQLSAPFWLSRIASFL